MSGRVPLGDELVESSLEGGEVGEVGGAEAFASEDPEPLLDRVHPGAVDRGDVSDETRVGSEPAADERPMMDRDVVGEQVDRRDRGGDGPVEVLQEGEIFDLAFAPGGDAVALAGAGVEGGNQVGGASSLVLVLDLPGSTGLRRAGGDAAWSGLERGHLVETEHHLVIGEQAGQQVSDGPNLGGKGRVTGPAWMEPDVRSPGLQAIGG